MKANFWRFWVGALSDVVLIGSLAANLLFVVMVHAFADLPYSLLSFYVRSLPTFPTGMLAWLTTLLTVGVLFDCLLSGRNQRKFFLVFVYLACLSSAGLYTLYWSLLYDFTGVQAFEAWDQFIAIAVFYVILLSFYIHKHGRLIAFQNFLDHHARPEIYRLLPKDCQGGILFLRAQEHYVQVHVQGGTAIIRMKLSDAISLCSPLLGHRVHRSYWVADKHLTTPVKEGRRWYMLIDQKKVSVSADFAKAYNDKGAEGPKDVLPIS